MSEIKIMPRAEVEAMFARLGEKKLDLTGIRRQFLNCPYGEDPKQMLDIYLPNEGRGPFPAIFFVHGGGWSGGSRRDAQLIPFINGVNRGYAVIGVGYRLVPHVRYPDNLFDIKAALRWVYENAETYLIDPQRTALCGASAGAQLAMMAAFTMGQAAFEEGPVTGTCAIRAVVNQFGPTDFTKARSHYDESGYARAEDPGDGEESGPDILTGVKISGAPNLLRFLNPIDSVHPGIPPVLIQHGRYDPIIAYQQSVELYDKINRIAGEGRAVLDLSETMLHADPDYGEPGEVEKLFAFLDKHLK